MHWNHIQHRMTFKVINKNEFYYCPRWLSDCHDCDRLIVVSLSSSAVKRFADVYMGVMSPSPPPHTVASPGTTRFYYNSIMPLVLIKWAASHLFIKNRYSCISDCSYLCCFSPSLLFLHLPLSFLCSFCGVCRRGIQLPQTLFSGSAAFTVSITSYATPGNYCTKAPAHSISIKCANTTFLSPCVTVLPVRTYNVRLLFRQMTLIWRW